jgi:hypothetical protein
MKTQNSNLFFRAFGAALYCLAGMTAHAAIIQKAVNTTDLNVASRWSGGVFPVSTDIASRDNSVTSANIVGLGAGWNYSGIEIADSKGTVTGHGAFTPILCNDEMPQKSHWPTNTKILKA